MCRGLAPISELATELLLVKTVNKMQEEPEEEEAPADPEPSAEEKLLTEIRDLLKQR